MILETSFDIDVENNSSNWRENRFDANLNGSTKIYTVNILKFRVQMLAILQL